MLNDIINSISNYKSLLYRGKKSKIDLRKMKESERAGVRKTAITLINKHERSPEDVAEDFGVCSSCVYKWIKKFKQGGFEALGVKDTRNTSRKKLTKDQESLVVTSLYQRNPEFYGYNVILWTREIIAELIERWFGITLTGRTVSRILRRNNYTFQKPERRSYKRDEKEIEIFKSKKFKAIFEKAQEEGAEIWWIDECTSKASHSSGKTWGLCGETPTVYEQADRIKINVVAAISNTGECRYMVFEDSMNSETFCSFIDYLHKKTGKKIYLILDNASFHQSKMTREKIEFYSGWLEVCHLPKYAPELNPVEYLWSHLKRNAIGKKFLKDLEELKDAVSNHITRFFRDKKLFLSLFGKKQVQYIKETITSLEAA